MKVRSCFVANSSSSSFIIAYKELPTLTNNSYPSWVNLLIETAVGSIIDMDDYAEEDVDIVTNIDELKKYYEGNYGENYINSYGNEEYKKLVSILELGFKLSFREVDYRNKSFSEFLNSLPKNDIGNGIFVVKSGH